MSLRDRFGRSRNPGRGSAPAVRKHGRSAYYRKNNPDQAESGLDVHQHFLERGVAKNRWPNKWFSPDYVLNRLSDRTLVGVNPVAAYLDSDLHQRPRLVFVSTRHRGPGRPRSSCG